MKAMESTVVFDPRSDVTRSPNRGIIVTTNKMSSSLLLETKVDSCSGIVSFTFEKILKIQYERAMHSFNLDTLSLCLVINTFIKI